MASRATFKFLVVAGFALGLTGFAAAVAAPHVRNYLKNHAQRLVVEAQASEMRDPHKAAVDYQMAAFLQPGDHAILHSLANMYIRLDQSDDAIAILRQLPFSEEGSGIADLQFKSGSYSQALDTLNHVLADKITAQDLVAKSRALLELDRGGEAVEAARQAITYSLGDTAAQFQLGLCQLITGDDAGYKASVAALGQSEAGRQLQSANAYKLALARVLYSQRLLRSSERVLDGMDSTPTERYLLMAEIKLAQARPSDQNLSDAKELLVRATKLDPASIDAHKKLEEVLLKQGDEAGATEQIKQIKALQTGQL